MPYYIVSYHIIGRACFARRATAARPTPAAAATPRRTFAAEMSCLIVCSSCCFVVSCFCTLCLLLSALSSLKLCVY